MIQNILYILNKNFDGDADTSQFCSTRVPVQQFRFKLMFRQIRMRINLPGLHNTITICQIYRFPISLTIVFRKTLHIGC